MQIRERTDGNPLFAQEFAAAVLDHDGFEIPTSLQALFVDAPRRSGRG